MFGNEAEDFTKFDGKPDRRALILKFAAPLVAVALIVFISKVQTPLTENISRQMKSAVTLGVDVDSSLGKSRFIDNLLPGDKAVSSNVHVNSYEVLKDFDATGHDGAVFSAVEDGEIKAAADGIIVSNTGRNIEIITSDGKTIIYEGCKEAPLAPCVRVKKGDLIATSDADGITVKVFVNSVQTDPVPYMANAESGQ